MLPDNAICPLCDAPEDQKMVQCDRCDKWYHFICVGVTERIAREDWMCGECMAAHENEVYKTPALKKADVIAEAQGKVHTKVVRVSSKYSSASENKKLAMARIEEERQVMMSYIKQKYAILNTYEESDDSLEDNHDRTRVWVQSNDIEIAQANAMQVKAQRKANENNEHPNVYVTDAMNKDNNFNDGGAWASVPNPKRDMQVPTTGEINSHSHNTTDQHSRALTESNIQARQVISKELPSFSGKPEEWPLFISYFESSTEICGFTNSENMLRLQRALKGKALDYVSSQLMISSMVPQVISTLKMVFGRPENIINSLLLKLRSSPNVNANKLDTIIDYAIEVKNIIATMEASDMNAHLNNPMLLQELVEKLPPQMRLNWAMIARYKQNVSLATFSDWLYEAAQAASSVVVFPPSNKVVYENERRKPQRVNFQKEDNIPVKCLVCHEEHEVSVCAKFEKASLEDKWKFVHNLALCRTCLKQHNPRYCRERKECGIDYCSAKHHPKLHNINSSPVVVASQQSKSSNVLYKIIPVTLYGNDKLLNTFAFLDDGSGPTLIDQDIVDSLNIDGQASNLSLKWTDGTVRREKDSKIINIGISPSDEPDKIVKLHNVRTVRGLDLPRQTLNTAELKANFKHLRGLPVKSYSNALPTVIVGLSNIRAAMPLKYREGKPCEPAAAKTRLGWTIFGTLNQFNKDARNSSNDDENLQLHIHEYDEDVSLHKLVSERMKLDDPMYNRDKHEEFDPKQFPKMQQAVQRDGNRFITKLLWKQEQVNLTDNFQVASRRLISFESKLLKDESLREQVNMKILQMVDKGYIRKLTANEVDENYPRKWYLPIFSVKNPNKPQKMRLVWDAASECRGISLNKCLDKGPDLLTPLIDVLLNFRAGRIGISADICEMYHRVGVDHEDQHSQRFLWRQCQQDRPPDVYVLTVMSFGANCSPSIAQFVKNMNALNFKNVYPRAVKSILERHYVDDMLDSVDTVTDAVNLATNVSEIHKHANFYIRNWLSNSKEVLDVIGNEGAEEGFCQAGNQIDQVFEPEKVLGLWWKTTEDTFTFSLKFTKACNDVLLGRRVPTKRELLRLVMSIFDPLGFLNFYSVHAKILLQKVWRSGIGWDEQLPESLQQEWVRWLQFLPQVSQVRVPRCYFKIMTASNARIELHILTDASECAYAAVVYFRIVSKENIDVSLICSKSKVAPLRPVSIPRMELMAAVMGARMGHYIKQAVSINIENTNFWTDSRTILHWLHSDPRTFKQFVMFRVGEIQELTDVNSWRYVTTKENVADLATKRTGKPDFSPNNRWFSGPEWLQAKNLLQADDHEEECVSVQDEIVEYSSIHTSEPSTIVNFQNFSKWQRLVNCMAYVKKFANIMLARKKQNQDRKIKRKINCDLSAVQNLTSNELEWSQNFLFRLAQESAFKWEILKLRKDPSSLLPNRSLLRKFSPYIDEHEVIRQRVRVQQTALVGILIVNPIVLPKTHYITRLLVEFYHVQFKHINHEAAINSIFEKFRIPGLRGLLRSIRASCISCKVALAKPEPPEMGMLPAERTATFTRPFTYVGVDFFGPLLVTIGRRAEKRYGVIFTCFTCRAVHIEVAHSLTTSSCIIAIRNFIARRGKPRRIFSDNGTNLKAASKVLQEASDDVNFQKLQAAFTTPDTTWSFIPPASPHMGGVWERLVRSIKTTLYKIVTPTTKMTDEILYNLLVEVESILNCRPLTYLSLDTADQEALTPNHILLGNACGNKPPGTFSERDQFKQSWRYSQLLADQFWKRWIAEILPEMTGRTKWFNRVRPIEVGNVCIIVDQNLPRHQWPKGIVVQVFPGKDQQVRSAVVHTANGDYHRPASKIAILDIDAPHSFAHDNGKEISTMGQVTGGEKMLRTRPKV